MKKIDLDLEILVANNARSSFFYEANGTSLELDRFGDDEYVSLRFLKSLSTGSSKRLLKNLILLIIDTNDENVTVFDVLENLKITRFYRELQELLLLEDDEIIDNDTLEDFILKANEQQFKKALDNEMLYTVLAETALHLYRENNIPTGYVEMVLTKQGVDNIYDFLDDVRMSSN